MGGGETPFADRRWSGCLRPSPVVDLVARRCARSGANDHFWRVADTTSASTGLLELAILAAAPVDRRVHYVAIPTGLTRDAGRDARQRFAAARRNLLSTLDTFQRAFPMWKAGPSALDAIGDRVVDLIQNRAFSGPTCRHFFPNPVGSPA